MNGKFQNIILVLIALTFSFNSFGFIFYFLVERENLKEKTNKEIYEKKSHNKIEVLTFSLSDYKSGNIVQRIDKKEFRYLGKMYDIVKEEVHAESIEFHCIHDEKEDKLEMEYGSNIQKHFDYKCITNRQLQFNHQINFVELTKKFNIFSPNDTNIYQYFVQLYKVKYYSVVLTPPPKCNTF